MKSQVQKLSWSTYYENIGNPSWLDMSASFLYNARYLFQIIKTKAQSVLEVGAGRGLHAIFLSYFVPRVIGIDVEESLIKKAVQLNKKFRGKAQFLKMDAFYTGFKDQSFSVCCSQGFFEHFTDSAILALIKEQLRVARSVVFSVPSCYYPRKNVGNERLMKMQEWKEMLNEYFVNGFYYGLNTDTAIGLIRSLKPTTLKTILSSPKKAQICLKVKRRLRC